MCARSAFMSLSRPGGTWVYPHLGGFTGSTAHNVPGNIFTADGNAEHFPPAAEVARVDTNNDGVISAAEGDVDTASDGFPTTRGCSFWRRASTASP